MTDDYRYYSSIPPGSPTNLPDWEPTFTVRLKDAGYAATDDNPHADTDTESEEAFAERLLGTTEDVVEEAPPEPEEEDDD